MKHGGREEIPPCESKCLCDDFENAIRKIGVEFACEWFGCSEEFAKETIKILGERSGMVEYIGE